MSLRISSFIANVCGYSPFLIAAFASLLPSPALAFDPVATCSGVTSTGQVARAAYVRARATLQQRTADGRFVDLDAVDLDAFSPSGGDVLLGQLPWHLPSLGVATYRVRLDSTVFDGVTSPGASAALLATWPTAQRFSLSVTGPTFRCGPTEPVVTSAPPATARVGEAFVYSPVVASTGDLRYSLLAGPIDMHLDEVTGELTWLPASSGGRSVAVLLQVEDPATDGFSVQAFTLEVLGR